MNVRPKKFAPQAKVNVPPQQPAVPFTFPAPSRGWVLNENLASPAPGGAAVLDNWICTTKSVRVRGGSSKYATLGAAVSSLMTYKSGTNERIFAATDSSIFDLTSVADPDVAPTADVTGQTAGRYSYEQFGTAGGNFLYAVNGADDAQLYDGTTWTAINAGSTPSITGGNTSDFSHVWAYANRIFFVRNGTMIADYLPVDSVGGALSQFSLAGVFKKGGAILFGATWSLDAGDGLDDKCVFVSTEGEVAVYQGTNPGSAADWSKVGVYDITAPVSQFGTMRAGGDLLIATRSGLVPVSESVNRDTAALSLAAASAPIAPYWQERAQNASVTPWEIMKWPEKNVMVVSQPDTSGGACLIANLQTGAWSRCTGWDVQCLTEYLGRGFFGAADGNVYEMDVTGSDDGVDYTAVYLGQHEGLGAPGIEKTVLQMRPILQSASPVFPQVTVATDYSLVISGAPSAANDTGTTGWDVGVWDTATWDDQSSSIIGGEWRAVGRTGRTIAPELQMTFNAVAAPSVEFVAADVTFEAGAVVT